MSTLPVHGVLPALLEALAGRNVAVLSAPPGAGKTTAVPPALLDAPWVRGRKILMLEPRRLAARAAATFMSRQRGETPGGTVGYRVQLDSRIGPATRIEVVTEGVLIRLLQDDPELGDYAAVIFDEFHERNLLGDLGLALALDAQQGLRDDLRLLVMSATLDTDRIAALLGDAPVIASEGRSHPVQVTHVSPPADASLPVQVAGVVDRVLTEQSGSVLVFLPGQGDIRRTLELLQPRLPADVSLHPLFGHLQASAQDAAIAPAARGARKVVLATNIAESSLTIEGIRVVVDSGLERRLRLDPRSGLSRLATGRISRASAEQRAGRAGRLEPGACYRLWSADLHQRLQPHSPPEIREADLAPLVLEVARWGVSDPGRLRWLDAPPDAAWAQGRDLLQSLGAVDGSGALTAHGTAMAELGVHPRLAHMLLEAVRRGQGWLGCLLAALLSERDPLAGTGERQADLALRLALFRRRPGQPRLQRLWLQAERLAARLGIRPGGPLDGDAGLLLAMAYPDRVGLRRAGAEPRYLLSGGRGARLHRDDRLAQQPMLVAADLDGEAREALIHRALPLPREAFEEACHDRIAWRDRVELDAATGRVVGRRVRGFGALVLEESALPRPSPEAAAEVLLQEIRRKGPELLPWSPASRQWQARVELLRRQQPGAWPDVGDRALADSLERWLAPYLAGCWGLDDVNRLPLQTILQELLDHGQRRDLERLAPAFWPLPSGSRARIDYLAGDSPVLAVRLQELFGCRETPAIVNGRLPLVLHLLSPAGRPVQVTRDLAGFWAGSYAEVRKDMRGRYPKHRWPENPLQAEPGRHTRRRPT